MGQQKLLHGPLSLLGGFVDFRTRQKITPYLFALPNTVIFTTFLLLPLIVGLGFSFFKGNFTEGLHWNGIANYLQLAQDKSFLSALFNTLWYVVGVVVLTVGLSLALAIALKKTTLGNALGRVGFYLPAILSPVVIGLSWRWLFGSETGLVNAGLQLLHAQTISWLNETFWARVLVILASVWSLTGGAMVLFIGGLNTISPDMYEAADVDGATPWQQFTKITLPLLKPTMVLVTTLMTINAFKSFEVLLVLTNGGPGTDTKLLVQNIYQVAFDEQNPTYASTQSVILFAILLIFTFIQTRYTKED